MPTPHQQDSETGSADSRRPRILVVDDNHANRVLMGALLGGLGCEPAFATNGRDAVSEADRTAFDIIFMDIRMPGLDGLQATRLVRDGQGASRDAVVLALTAHCDPSEHDAYREAGIDAVVTKPVSAAKLADVLTSTAARDAAE